jgi:hypothetical protein
MRITRGAIVLGIAAILSVPLRAQTAAGWILWEKNMASKPGAPMSVTWVPMDGYDALAECRKAGQTLLGYALSYMKDGAGKILGPVRPDGRSAIFAVTTDGVQGTVDIRYLCFPGGFDPRPRNAPAP